MKRTVLAMICAVGCVGHAGGGTMRPTPLPAATEPLAPLHPYPRILALEGKGPDWCWSTPHALGPRAYRDRYVVLLAERAILSVLNGNSTPPGLPNTKDPLFSRLADIRASGEQVFLVAPAAIDPRDLSANVHSVTSAYPAVARAWDRAAKVQFVRLIVNGYVEDPGGTDGLRMEASIQGAFGQPRVSRRYGIVADLCVTADDSGALTIHTWVSAEF